MKTVYRATRGDKKALLNDIKPGMSLFVINEHVGNSGPSKTYSEYIVTTEKMPFTRTPVVQSPVTRGKSSLESLLSREREIYTQRPALPNLGARDNHSAYTEDAQRTATLVADLHAQEAALAMSREWSLAGRR
ncbi:hypothetical protein [Streptomyces flavochromogenes]|uniref:hypothetical protein n=1 Tax=Streptomyces flavochromogenes TaxID=68199 RepID=UPI0004C0880F|nr:hypothetical protein [Streptomyces flavochromogenes]